MPGPVYHVNNVAICPHGGQVQVAPTNARVLVNGQPVALFSDPALIAGCAFNVASVPQPCLRVQWLVPAVRVQVMGQPVLLQTSAGLCLGPTQAPQGPASVLVNQPRVVAT
jgi:hypothetical protein